MDRLSTSNNKIKICCLIIGTFNPGEPDLAKLDATEKRQFESLSGSKKYKEFQKIHNFYDRSKNRFWKVLDILQNEEFYNSDFKKINPNGLKYYKTKVKMNAVNTYQKQQEFCKSEQIYITDLVKSINPISFCDIYDSFPDTIIEKSDPDWNTPDIIEMINNYSISKILVNFDFNSKSTPKLNGQISKIKEKFEKPYDHVFRIMSPSGAAQNTYEELVTDWKKHIEIQKPIANTGFAHAGSDD